MNENEEHAIHAVAADIAQVLEKSPEAKRAAPVQIVEVARLKEADYCDPTSEQYVMQHENLTNTPAARTTTEGIAMIHKAIHSTGEQPVW